MKNALLITNGFIKSDKFNEIYGFLEKACLDRQVLLISMKNSDFMFLSNDNEVIKNQIDNIIYQKIGKKVEIDFVIFWDKDVYLAKCLENAGYKVFNNSQAILCCDDKALTTQEMSITDVKIPKTITAPMTFKNIGYSSEFIDEFLVYCEDTLGYPYIIKERFGSFGMQVYLVNNKDEGLKCIEKIKDNPFIIQEYIKESYGRDIRINMVGQNAVASMLRKNDNGDFRANITIGGSMYNYVPGQEELRIARKCMDTLKLDFGGIDILFGKNDFYLCEVNSNAHFKNIYDLTNINIADEIIDYIIQKS